MDREAERVLPVRSLLMDIIVLPSKDRPQILIELRSVIAEFKTVRNLIENMPDRLELVEPISLADVNCSQIDVVDRKFTETKANELLPFGGVLPNGRRWS